MNGMPTKDKSVLIPARLELRVSELETLRRAHGGTSTQEEVATDLANYFLREYAAGGLMVKATDITTVEEVLGEKVQTGQQIASAFLSTKGRAEGQFVLTAEIDPAFMPNIEELCQWRGITPNDLLQEMMSYAMTEGWLYSFEGRGGRFDATEEDKSWMDDFMGRKGGYTMADFLVKVREVVPETVGAR